MAVISTAVAGRARFVYMDNAPAQQFSGINPAVSALQFMSFANALQNLQDADLERAYVFREFDLEEA